MGARTEHLSSAETSERGLASGGPSRRGRRASGGTTAIGWPSTERVTPEWRTWPAVADTVRLARRTLVRFAEAAGAGEELLDRVRLAASEAVTNVVIHAYRDRGNAPVPAGPVHVGAAVASGADRDELWVLVADEGCGLQPRDDSPGAGQGLRLIAHAVDGLTIIRRAEGGTELQMRFDLDAGADRSAEIVEQAGGRRAVAAGG
jgi:serine/threonine-protein kinase RsbW